MNYEKFFLSAFYPSIFFCSSSLFNLSSWEVCWVMRCFLKLKTFFSLPIVWFTTCNIYIYIIRVWVDLVHNEEISNIMKHSNYSVLFNWRINYQGIFVSYFFLFFFPWNFSLRSGSGRLNWSWIEEKFLFLLFREFFFEKWIGSCNTSLNVCARTFVSEKFFTVHFQFWKIFFI